MNFYDYFRRPRTKQAKQVAAGDTADGLPPRGKRSAVNIPDSYDDIPIGARADKSWKRLRKSAWRRIANV